MLLVLRVNLSFFYCSNGSLASCCLLFFFLSCHLSPNLRKEQQKRKRKRKRKTDRRAGDHPAFYFIDIFYRQQKSVLS